MVLLANNPFKWLYNSSFTALLDYNAPWARSPPPLPPHRTVRPLLINGLPPNILYCKYIHLCRSVFGFPVYFSFANQLQRKTTSKLIYFAKSVFLSLPYLKYMQNVCMQKIPFLHLKESCCRFRPQNCLIKNLYCPLLTSKEKIYR